MSITISGPWKYEISRSRRAKVSDLWPAGAVPAQVTVGDGQPYSGCAADVWSSGCVLCAAALFALPFGNHYPNHQHHSHANHSRHTMDGSL